MRIHIPSPISDSSSLYSSVLTANQEIKEQELWKGARIEPQKPNPVKFFQLTNPYADSLWYSTQGDEGNAAIKNIQERVNGSKRTREHDLSFEIPMRHDSINRKQVDSPIKNEDFKLGFDNIKCDTPKFKGLKSPFPGPNLYKDVFHELVESEIQYHADLTLIETIYKNSLYTVKKFQNIMTPDEESLIFNNISTIIKLSEFLVKQISTGIRDKMLYEVYDEDDLCKSLRFCDVSQIDIGEILLSFISRVKISYKSYFKKNSLQLQELKKLSLNNPKFNKWLESCCFLAKSKSQCMDLESLLIKPIERLTKYKILIRELVNNYETNNQEYLKNLKESQEYLDKILTEFNSIDPNSPSDMNEPINQVLKKDDDELINLITIFRRHYHNLNELKISILSSLPSFQRFLSDQLNFAIVLKAFMVDDYISIENENFIKSVYDIYLDKLKLQQQTIESLNNDIVITVTQPIDLLCSSVLKNYKTRITKLSSYRTSYNSYLHNNKRKFVISQHVINEAQHYILISNQLKLELPGLLQKLDEFARFAILNYNLKVTSWFKTLCGEKSITEYQKMVNEGLITRDNFDIIQMYSISKQQTRLALKEMDSFTSPVTHPSSVACASSAGIIPVSSNKVVRKLFSV